MSRFPKPWCTVCSNNYQRTNIPALINMDNVLQHVTCKTLKMLRKFQHTIHTHDFYNLTILFASFSMTQILCNIWCICPVTTKFIPQLICYWFAIGASISIQWQIPWLYYSPWLSDDIIQCTKNKLMSGKCVWQVAGTFCLRNYSTDYSEIWYC
jgi:hypothetical protein